MLQFLRTNLTKSRAILKYCLQIIFPWNSLNYLVSYATVAGKTCGKASQSAWIRLVYWINMLHLVNIVKFLYLTRTDVSVLERAILFDGFFGIFALSIVAFLGAQWSALAIYFNHVLLLEANPRLTTFLIELLHGRKPSFFLRDQKRLLRSTRRLFRLVFSVFRTLILSGAIQLPLIYMSYVGFLWHSSSLSSALFMTAGMHLNVVLHLLYYYNVTHDLALAFTIAMTLVRIFFAKMSQLSALLDRMTRADGTKLKYFHYLRYRQRYTNTLAFFFALNRMYGRVFLATLLVVCPETVAMRLWLAYDRSILTSHISRAFMLFFLIQEDLLSFVIHLCLSFCSARIHRSGKALASLQVRRGKKLTLRTRLRLAHDFAAIHTPNRYGFTYGAFGLISLAAFSKYLMLYGKIVMISYKMMQQSKGHLLLN